MSLLLFIFGFMLVLAGTNDTADGKDVLVAVIGLALLFIATLREVRNG